MKIAIVGLGVAGSYLSSRLSDGNYIVGYERMKEDKFDAVCAWGTSKYTITDFVKKTGLNFEDYVMHDGKYMYVDLGGEMIHIRLKGLCTFDKLSLIKDMVDAHKVHFGKCVLNLPQDDDYDLVVDATGLHRPLLPKLKDDICIPCVQYMAKFKDPPYDDFYIKPLKGLSGYLWYFPLENGYAHLGAGDYYKTHNEELSIFLNKHPGEVLKKAGRPIRITPPNRCIPFVDRNVVGVGESVGTVYPLLGEGIIPSLQCSELFIENQHDFSAYQRRVLEKFHVYKTVFEFVKAMIKGNGSFISQFPHLLSIYLHMKSNERRYGLEVRLKDMLRVLGLT